VAKVKSSLPGQILIPVSSEFLNKDGVLECDGSNASGDRILEIYSLRFHSPESDDREFEDWNEYSLVGVSAINREWSSSGGIHA